MTPEWETQATRQLTVIRRNNAIMQQAREQDLDTKTRIWIGVHPMPGTPENQAKQDETAGETKTGAKPIIGTLMFFIGGGAGWILIAFCILRFIWSFLWDHSNQFMQGTVHWFGIAILCLIVAFVGSMLGGDKAAKKIDRTFHGDPKPPVETEAQKANRQNAYEAEVRARFGMGLPARTCWCANIDADMYAESLDNALRSGAGETAQRIIPLQITVPDSLPVDAPVMRNALASLSV